MNPRVLWFGAAMMLFVGLVEDKVPYRAGGMVLAWIGIACTGKKESP